MKSKKICWEDVIYLFNGFNFEILSNKENFKLANISKIKFKCKKCGYIDHSTYSYLKYKYNNNNGCKICKSFKKMKNIQFLDIKQWFEDERWTVYSTEKDYKNQNSTPIDCACPNGHRQWKSVRKWRLGRRCSQCNSSGPELELRKFLEKLDVDVKYNERRVLNGIVLDFYFPKLNKAIEFNGDYWHCNPNLYSPIYKNKNKNLYANEIWVKDRIKKRKCIKNNIKLITIWNYEWENYKLDTQKRIEEFLWDFLNI